MVPANRGGRFSRNAASASFASPERTCTLNASFSALIAVLIWSRNGPFNSRLLACSAPAGFVASVRAVAEDGTGKKFGVDVRVDTPQEVEYYRNGGILPYVLRQLAGKA